jgi:hypothetical protein
MMKIPQDLMVGNTKIGSNFALSGLLSKGVIWKQF